MYSWVCDKTRTYVATTPCLIFFLVVLFPIRGCGGRRTKGRATRLSDSMPPSSGISGVTRQILLPPQNKPSTWVGFCPEERTAPLRAEKTSRHRRMNLMDRFVNSLASLGLSILPPPPPQFALQDDPVIYLIGHTARCRGGSGRNISESYCLTGYLGCVIPTRRCSCVLWRASIRFVFISCFCLQYSALAVSPVSVATSVSAITSRRQSH